MSGAIGSQVALGPWGRGETAGGASAPNMLGMLGEVMKLRQTQQEWAARSRFGDIMAGSGGDLDTALSQAQQDPTVGAWAPQLMTELRNQQLLHYRVQDLQMGQAKTGREALEQALVTSDTEDQLLPALQRSLSALPLQTQKEVLGYGQTLHHALSDGLDKIEDPQARAAQFAMNKANMMIRTKLGTPETAYSGTGAGVWMPPGVREITDPDTGAPRLVPYGGVMGLPGRPAPAGGAAGSGGAGGAGTGAGLQAGVPLATGPTIRQKGILETDADYVKKVTPEFSDVLQQHAPAIMQTMDTIVDKMKDFQTGGLADKEIFLAKDIQGLQRWGAPLVGDLMKDMTAAGGKLSQAQVIQALTKYYSTQLFKEAATGAGFGRLNIEAQQFASMLDVTQDPAAIVELLNQTKRNIQRGVDQAANWPAFRDSPQGHRLADYPQFWSENRAGKEVEKYGGMNFKPYDPKDVLGGAHQDKVGDLRRNKDTGAVGRYVGGYPRNDPRNWVDVDPNTGRPLGGQP